MQNDRLKFKEDFKKRLYVFVLKLIKFVGSLNQKDVVIRVISEKSSNESKVWIALLRDSEKCNKNEANELLKELDVIANIFASSVLTLKGKK